MGGRLVPEPAPHTHMTAPTHAHWEQLRRLLHVLDARLPITGSPPELVALRQLLPTLGLVAREFATDPRDQSLRDRTVGTLDPTEVRRALTRVVQHDQFIAGKFRSLVNSGAVQRLCRRAYALALTEDAWPVTLSVGDDGSLATGMVVRSLNGLVEGRTTGGRRRCPAPYCGGWDVSVSWESGQDIRICSEGWHFDPVSRELRIVGGGEITARTAGNPTPDVRPLPRDAWPSREVLRTHPAWADLAQPT